jgi:6-phosphofructokinase 1
MKRIAVLTSGGDAPGMNAAIRAVTRVGIGKGWEVFGVRHGFQGLMDGEIKLMGARDVGGIIQQGGTFLGSARAPEMKTEAGQRKALRNLNQNHIEGLVVIGGNGSQTGAYALHKLGFKVVGVASTIDNDLYGSDVTIGVDTALNIALEAIDRLKVTASSHLRAFMVEVMGRDCGYLALVAGIAGGAEAIIIPEVETTPQSLSQTLMSAYERGKTHGLVVVAEGAKFDVGKLEEYFKEHSEDAGFDVRTTRLGHVQRGGVPTVADRILATRLGAAAVDELEKGNSGILVGVIGGEIGEIITTPLEEVAGKHRPVNPKLLELAEMLAR